MVMRVLLSWLKEYIDIQKTPEEIAELLTSAGIEVDNIESVDGKDSIFEVSLTPNLGHVMSILGLARELSAITGIPIKTKPEVNDKTFSHLKAGAFSIKVETKDC